MQIRNFIQIGHLEIAKFIRLILAMQLMILGLIGLDQIGLQIPVLRQIIGFIYLTFVPGILVLRLLKIPKLGNICVLLYSCGLSIGIVMFTGFFLNFSGLSHPFSLFNLLISLSAIVMVLLVLCYIFDDKSYFNENFINLNSLNPTVIFLCFLPVLAIFGTYLMNYYNLNYVIFVLLILISLIPFLFNKIDPKFFPIAILMVSLALILHRSLISSQLWGSDIYEEYYFANLVATSTVWNFSIPSDVNGMLSIVSLPIIYSIICNLSLDSVFKIIYPIIYSIVPLGLFLLFERNTNKEVAFLATLFFMFVSGFYGVLPSLARQEIGELFFVLLILLIFDKREISFNNSFLFVFFSFSLVVSHYALSYFFSLFIVLLFISLILIKNKERTNITGVLFFLVFVVAWYMYASGSSSFNNIVNIFNHMINSFYSDFLDPSSTEGLATVLAGTTSLLYSILKYIYLMAEFFVAIGLLAVILHYISKKVKFLKNRINKYTISLNSFNFTIEYLFLSLYSFLAIAASIIIPEYSGNFGTLRLFYLMLIFLSPFLIIGFIILLDFLRIITKRKSTKRNFSNYLKVASIFLVVFLLLDSGVIHQITNDPNPNSISLSTNENYKESVYVYSQGEIQGAYFLKQVMSNDNNSKVFTDIFGRQILRGYIYPKIRILVFRESGSQSLENKFIFFRKLNVDGKLQIIPTQKLSIERPYLEQNIQNTSFYNEFYYKNKIYVDGDSEIYK
ncbi:DUF2206 domain-containing protein [Methanobacterium sp.]|uniref:DUF2206 domain-containing protein n=1 Tax=Methanobacterium sp. TaxID=2164 RepID=UPI0031586DF2